ncbi:NAD(P)H-binding protein [Rhodococcus sp. NPDC058521]|uniref:NmrA family NAD(P)-binding protein n=1 Tax=Rhodococcus sp. NPDC058521 TaxID=3346536 RepID=UPI0036555BD7
MTILVTGATGNIGRMVVDHLLARGATDVRALTNKPEKANLPAGVDVAKGYLRNLDSLDGVFDGVDSMYLAPTPETTAQVLALAKEAGVRYVVDLSGEHESHWGDVTRAVEDSGLAWTHLWPDEFMENSIMLAEQIKNHGVVREPFPDSASPLITMNDIAEVAAALLVGGDRIGESLSITGPESISRRELVQRIGNALGREIEFRQVSPEEGIEALTPAMGDYAQWYVQLKEGDGAGYVVPANDLVEQITGRPATGIDEWLKTHADEFR